MSRLACSHAGRLIKETRQLACHDGADFTHGASVDGTVLAMNGQYLTAAPSTDGLHMLVRRSEPSSDAVCANFMYRNIETYRFR